MKVAYLTWGYPSAAAPYAGSFFRNQVDALRDLGLDLEVVAPVPWVPRAAGWVTPRLRRYCNTPRAGTAGAATVTWPRYLAVAPRLWRLGVLHRFLQPVVERTLAKRPDLVHVHGGSSLGFATARAAERNRVPMILTLHGSDVNVYPTLSARHRCHFKHTVRSAARVFAVSEALADRTVALVGIRPQVLPIGVDVRRFSADKKRDKQAARAYLGIPADKHILLYVGNLTAAKGVIDLVEATRSLSDANVHCVFVGDGRLRGYVSKLPNTSVVGQVCNDRVPEYMAAADVLVLPSHSEGMPTVIVEAGMMGLPVIATDVGGIPELLSNDRGMLVAAGQPRSLRDAIESSISNPNVLMSMAVNLNRYVRRRYDAAENAKSLLDAYREAVSGWPSMKAAIA